MLKGMRTLYVITVSVGVTVPILSKGLKKACGGS